MRRFAMVLLLLGLFLLLPGRARADDPAPPYPAGTSVQEWDGLKFRLILPEPFDPKGTYSLVVGLHGAGSNDADFASWFEPLVPEGFVVCAPKSTGPAWSRTDLKKVVEIVRHLLEVLPIGEGRLHAAGFSNGGMHLPYLVFQPDLPFATACFMGSGFSGGRVPRRAKEGLSVVVLVGSEDPFAPVARRTPERLKGKVRFAVCREQPGLGHEIPDELMPWYYQFLRVTEGRFLPGEDETFDWWRNPASAREEMAEKGVGGFVYFFDPVADEKSEETRHLQNEVFFSDEVQKAAAGRIPLLCERELEKELFEKFGLTKTPAIVVLDADFRPTATFEGHVDAAKLIAALN